MKLTLDPNGLTFGDLEDFETASGEGLMATFGKIDKTGDLSGLKVKAMVALVWVCARQDNPEFTLDDARRLKVTDLEIEVAEPPDPTPGGD